MTPNFNKPPPKNLRLTKGSTMPGWIYIWETLTIKKHRNEDKTPLGAGTCKPHYNLTEHQHTI